MGAATNTVSYHFTVTRPGIDLELMRTLVIMAIKETDLVFSPARRKLETNVQLSSEKATCAIAGGTECGDHLARLVSGFLIKQFGEDEFVVKRREVRAFHRWRNDSGT